MFRYKKEIKPCDKDAVLPKNRKELFFDILKNDTWLLVDISLMIALFSLPLIIALGGGYMLFTHIETPSQNEIFSIVFYLSIVLIPCMGLRYLSRAGAFGVMKVRCFNEACIFSAKYLRCIKENGKKFFLAGLVVGVSLFVFLVGSIWSLYSFTEPLARGVSIGICAVQLLFVYVCAEYSCTSFCVYELKFGEGFRNATFFFGTKILYSILYFLVTLVLPVAICLFSVWGAVAVAIFVCAFGDGVQVLVATLFSHSVFDRYINKDNYPELVGKGLSEVK